MSKKRLYKSSNAVIGGICGGIAEYFDIDPTLVRIIAVALLLVGWGLPALLYVVLLVIVPPDPDAAQGYVDTHAEATKPHEQQAYDASKASRSEHTSASVAPTASAVDTDADQPPPPDPSTRVTSASYQASEGSSQANNAPMRAAWMTSTVADSVKSNSPAVLVIGALLIGVGVIALLSNFVHISLWRFWPVVLIVVGVVCLFTPGNRGWSLERAGNSIVLISIGIALLAWMLQIIQTKVLLAAFFDLWPILLVVLGLAIIGAARKSSMIFLASSLVLSATIIFGLWVYGGLNWESVATTSLLSDTDGLQELIRDIVPES
ncbi:MAG: PspC domain-containing protein [Coriobacteriia bacterium]|nr:PspC domain-containing protein [Coriobacteriia bacterium]